MSETKDVRAHWVRSALADIIKAHLLGVRLEDQAVVLEDRDWEVILAALEPAPKPAGGDLVDRDYTATAIADACTEIDRKLSPDFPDYAEWPIALPAGHWRALRAMLAAAPTPPAVDARDVGELVEALEPFAAIAREYDDSEDDDFQVWKDFDVLGATLPLRIFRRARAALAAYLSAYNRASELEVALRTLIERLDTCVRHERGAGGMTIEAQLQRTVLLDVRESWVEDAREVLDGAA